MENIIDIIKCLGTPDKPISSKQISEMSGLDGVSIRKAINKARCDGIPICSSNHGYYYSENSNEIISTIQSLIKRTISVENAINGLLKNLKTEIKEK